MKFMVIVKATKESEAGVLPSKKLLEDMGKYNEELVKAGVMLAGEGLQPSSKGARVRFSVTVRYVLQAAEKGDLALVFRDQRGDPILREYGITSEIKRGTGDATLSQEVTIPKGVWDMWLWIPVIPDGVSNPTGILQVRYPVVRPH